MSSANQANEEYEIEKSNIVRSETASIDQSYEKKYKKAELSQQIVKSTVANQVRLKVLAAKEDLLQQVFDEAASKLKSVTSDKSKYETLLSGLIQEGLYALMEEEVSVRVRKQDVDIAKKASATAATEFEKKSSKSVSISIDESDYLPDNSAGGVIIINSTGKIDVNNTLEERLKLLSESALPEIRLALFGATSSRKFFD
jgi:V-type H+-transporting ATPase subunit E